MEIDLKRKEETEGSSLRGAAEMNLSMRVRSLALLSGLRIWHCPELWCRSQMKLECGVAVVVAVA